jgi:antitoxin ParD1/3/4
MPTRNINLTEHLDRFVEARVISGRYGNASEVVREGLRLLEHREQEDKAKLKWLRGAVKEGLDQLERGEGIEFRSLNQLDADLDQLGAEASAQLGRPKQRG